MTTFRCNLRGCDDMWFTPYGFSKLPDGWVMFTVNGDTDYGKPLYFCCLDHFDEYRFRKEGATILVDDLPIEERMKYQRALLEQGKQSNDAA